MTRPLLEAGFRRNFFPMSQIPDLVWQLQKRSINYGFVRDMKDAGRFVYLKHRGRLYVQMDSLAEWLGVSATVIREQFRDDQDGVR